MTLTLVVPIMYQILVDVSDTSDEKIHTDKNGEKDTVVGTIEEAASPKHLFVCVLMENGCTVRCKCNFHEQSVITLWPVMLTLQKLDESSRR
jgi:hypothetical protein